MRRFISILALTLFLSSCGKNYGSLTGNVFWKYNNFVGNKPDGGSTIYFYPYEMNSEPLKVTADVQGNFRFDKVPSGDYLLIVVSENTTPSPNELYRELYFNSTYLKDVFNFDFLSIRPEKHKEYNLRDSLYRSSIAHENMNVLTDRFLKQMRDRDKKEDTLRKVANEIIRDIPSNVSSKLGIFIHKVNIKKVTIEKDKTDNEVIDFGITYL